METLLILAVVVLLVSNAILWVKVFRKNKIIAINHRVEKSLQGLETECGAQDIDLRKALKDAGWISEAWLGIFARTWKEIDNRVSAQGGKFDSLASTLGYELRATPEQPAQTTWVKIKKPVAKKK